MSPPGVEQTHTMLLQSTSPDGAEEWLCPTCGRRFFVNWQPEYKKTVAEPGDETAAHTGSKGMGQEFALTIGASYVSFEEPGADEPLPEPFREWWEKRSA